jgi:hypothetical protein
MPVFSFNSVASQAFLVRARNTKRKRNFQVIEAALNGLSALKMTYFLIIHPLSLSFPVKNTQNIPVFHLFVER